MTVFEAVLLAAIQGASELFPVSSLGHAVVIPRLAGWRLDQHTLAFLPFLVMLHVGTATALLAYFWSDWWGIARGVFGLADRRKVRESRRLFLLIVIATIPAAILGFTLEKFFRSLFGAPLIAAPFLALNGILLIVGERLRVLSRRPLVEIGARDAFIIGLFQSAALIPGISRSGAAMLGGLSRGVDHEGSAHFAFLIAAPIIAGAAVLEIPKLLAAHALASGMLGLAALGAVLAGSAAYASTAFLMRYFRNHDRWALAPFGWYCILFGLGSLALLWQLG